MAKQEEAAHHERHDFLKGKLNETSFKNPYEQFNSWYKQAEENGCEEPHSVVLSTASLTGKPASRIVYMREIKEDGFIVYTNYKSRKGEEIADNPQVSLLFYWNCSEQQVRVEGTIEKVPAAVSDAYFDARPRISKIGAWASEQSQPIENRATLEERVKFFEEKYPNKVPRPPHWGGFIIKPTYFEFWQGRKGRLHDRICFDLKTDEQWDIFRIAP